MQGKKGNRVKNEQLEINRELARIARERLEFDKAEAVREKKFWNMGSSRRLPVVIAALAVVVTFIVQGGSVLTTWISKDKEIRVSTNQRQLELERLEAQKKREWDLALAQFVLTNQRALFNGTPDEQRILAKVIPTIFPQDVSVTLLDRLAKTSQAPNKAIWTQAKTRVENFKDVDTNSEPIRDAKVAVNKPAQNNSISPVTFPWQLNPGSDKYGSLTTGTLTTDITGMPSVRSNFLDISNARNPNISDLVYRPSSSGLGTNTFDLSLLNTPAALPSPEGTTIQGTIVDAKTGKPLSGATIEFRSQPNWIDSTISLNPIRAKSDESGSFSILIPTGRYSIIEPIKLEIVSEGYKATTKELKNSYSSIIPVSLGNVALERGTP